MDELTIKQRRINLAITHREIAILTGISRNVVCKYHRGEKIKSFNEEVIKQYIEYVEEIYCIIANAMPPILPTEQHISFSEVKSILNITQNRFNMFVSSNFISGIRTGNEKGKKRLIFKIHEVKILMYKRELINRLLKEHSNK